MRLRILAAMAGCAMSGAAMAAPVVGDSNASTFSNISGCGLITCVLTSNGGNGADSRVEWGDLGARNTLTARDTAFSVSAPANDVVVARLRWANTVQLFSPQSFDVDYGLVLTFSTPSGGAAVSVPLEIRGPIGADVVLGLTVAGLSGLVATVPGLVISDLKFALDTTDSTPGTTFNPGTGRWALPETGASTMLITADFALASPPPRAVAAPAALGLLGLGLLGLAAVRRQAGATVRQPA